MSRSPFRRASSAPEVAETIQDLVRALEAGHYDSTPRFHVPGKRVALEPFPAATKKAEVKGGVLVPLNQAALTGLRVVFSSDGYNEGQVAYVRSGLPQTTSYAKQVYEVAERKFILVPEDEVLLLERRQVPPEPGKAMSMSERK